jgi:uncharacterized protein YlzI (FlbEa/FlbD family)
MEQPVGEHEEGGAMIDLHKLKGQVVWINPDLISIVEKSQGGADVRVTLTDGSHLVVSDPPEVIAEAVRAHRAAVLALAFRMHDGNVAGLEPHLHAVPDPVE